VNLAPGSTFGPYKILEPLGRGGMASVFKAYEPALDRYVALKVLPAESVQNEASAERFRREAKVIARLEHPNITPIHGFGIDERTQIPWMAMRLISGGTLSSRLTMRLTPPRAVSILRGVAEALDYAHGKNVMHRDVKPANILLDEAGRVYLADFGIARLVEGATQLTAAGLISGTPAYMAPEQATGVNVDHRVDVYALGIVAYEALAGRVPFPGENPIDVLMKQVQAPVPEVQELPEPVMDALRKALAKKADERWESAGAFVSALEAAVGVMPAPPAQSTDPALLAVTVPGAGATAVPGRAAGATTDQGAIPTRVAAAAVDEAAPTRARPGLTAATAIAPVGGRRSGMMVLIVGAVGFLALALAGGLYLALAPSREATMTESAATTGAAVPPTTAAPGPSPAGGAPAEVAPPPRTDPPQLEAPPATTLARPPDPRPRDEAPVRTAAVPPPLTAPPATAPARVETAPLRLDVVASQPSFGAQSGSMEIEVHVDGRSVKTATLHFDGTTPFARSRRRQMVEVPGVPVGRRAVAIVVRADGGVAPIEARTEATVGEGASPVVVDVRLRGNGEGDARFR
jgi:tRNA A-37 threonylcarbamoyl transferase component Bud32